MSKTIIASRVELSFDKNLFEPKVNEENGTKKRQCNFIETGDTKFVLLQDGNKKPFPKAKLTEVVEQELKDKFAGKVPPKFKNWAIRPNTDSVSQKTGERFEGYEDDEGIHFSPSRFENQGYPAFVRKDGSVIPMDTEDGVAEAKRLFKAGAIVNAKINIGAFDIPKVGKGVSSYMEAIQFVDEGTPRGGSGAASADGFDVIEDDGDDI